MGKLINRGYATGYAVAVLIITPQGVPLIRDPKKPVPVFWKLPGGRSNASETAEQTAVREVREEIGIIIKEKELRIIYQEDRENHILIIFRIDLPALPQLKKRGDEGEEIKIFSPQEILSMNDFFPNHKRVVEKISGLTFI